MCSLRAVLLLVVALVAAEQKPVAATAGAPEARLNKEAGLRGLHKDGARQPAAANMKNDAAHAPLAYTAYPNYDCNGDDAECKPFWSCRDADNNCVSCCEQGDPKDQCMRKLEAACDSNKVSTRGQRVFHTQCRVTSHRTR